MYLSTRRSHSRFMKQDHASYGSNNRLERRQGNALTSRPRLRILVVAVVFAVHRRSRDEAMTYVQFPNLSIKEGGR